MFQIVRAPSWLRSPVATEISRSYRSWPMTGSSLATGSVRSATSCSSVTAPSLATLLAAGQAGVGGLAGARLGDEVDQLLDPAEQGRFQVGETADRAQD